MTRVKALVTIVAGKNQSYPPGSVVPIEDDEEALRLIERGFAAVERKSIQKAHEPEK